MTKDNTFDVEIVNSQMTVGAKSLQRRVANKCGRCKSERREGWDFGSTFWHIF